jgi:DUF971 family protein
MSIHPTALRSVDPGALEITWSDGAIRRYAVRDLRRDCPCASCREQRLAPPPPETSLTVLSPAELQPLRIAKMEPVGRYAYSIHFSDGHDTGIYTLELLRELGESASN